MIPFLEIDSNKGTQKIQNNIEWSNQEAVRERPCSWVKKVPLSGVTYSPKLILWQRLPRINMPERMSDRMLVYITYATYNYHQLICETLMSEYYVRVGITWSKIIFWSLIQRLVSQVTHWQRGSCHVDKIAPVVWLCKNVVISKFALRAPWGLIESALSTAQGAVKDNHPCWQSFWECPEITFGCQKMQNPQNKGGIPQLKKNIYIYFPKIRFPCSELVSKRICTALASICMLLSLSSIPLAVCHPVAKHDSTKQSNDNQTKNLLYQNYFNPSPLLSS